MRVMAYKIGHEKTADNLFSGRRSFFMHLPLRVYAKHSPRAFHIFSLFSSGFSLLLCIPYSIFIFRSASR